MHEDLKSWRRWFDWLRPCFEDAPSVGACVFGVATSRFETGISACAASLRTGYRRIISFDVHSIPTAGINQAMG